MLASNNSKSFYIYFALFIFWTTVINLIPPYALPVLIFSFCLLAFYHSINRSVLSIKMIDQCVILFLIYYILQSPLFAKEDVAIEAVYYFIKAFSVLFIILTIKKLGLNFFTSLTILFLFILDAYFIIYINLGIGKSSTEYFSIYETLSAVIISFYTYIYIFQNQLSIDRLKNFAIIFFAIGHFANYFAAGFTKTLLDGGALSWIQNQTFTTLARADLWGISVPGWLLDYDSFLLLELPSNIIVLLIQLLSSLIAIFPVIISPLSIVYDIFHFAVGALAGVWFYKWAAINVIIFINRKQIIDYFSHLNVSMKMLLTASFPLLYVCSSVPHLGWYEYTQGSLIYAYGVDKNGQRDRLHHQHFGSMAFTILDKKTMHVFDVKLPAQMAGLSFSEISRANDCQRKQFKQNDKLKLNARRNLNILTKRIIDDRNKLRKFLFYIQPYHILMPSFDLEGPALESKYEKIIYELRNVCLDPLDYTVKLNEVVDHFEVAK